MADGGYSFSLTTFNKFGKLTQIEHALNAVSKGKTALGIKAVNGVVLIAEKKMPSPLVDSDQVHRIEVINEQTGVVFAGLAPDSRVLVKKCRKQSQSYFQVYRENQPIEGIVREGAGIMQEYTQSGGVRPFGVSLLIAGVDDDGPHLFQVDPSGAYFEWKASAIGKNFINARNFLERRYNEEMELEDAIHTALLTLKEGFEGEMTEHNIEVGVVTKEERRFRILTPAEVRDYLDEAM